MDIEKGRVTPTSSQLSMAKDFWLALQYVLQLNL